MKCNFSTKLYGWFYHSSCKKEIKKNYESEQDNIKAIKKEYISIILRAKDIGNSKLLSAYCMAAYFISICRMTKMPPDEAYGMFKDALYANRLFHIAMGDAESYLNPKRMPERKQWEKDSHLHKYENDWVVVVLDKTDQYDLGYDYHDCGICKLCQDEGCFELAKYLCQLDFVMADMMGLSLKRTQTIAEGAKYCDFRYSKKQ
ncbi:L-2-amino-thiazoline-4-carboxylic acid hydrolase [Youngiibacter fragilis]|uniref:L-2-amino-thiazoline-4-carboxylic acid hydrolase n=1 Tax=Youngiibacter fragilis 232.1 TaxID=994573 RepID=V7IA36_9CLOT|nr:L-2-amino-thiazoline-4-carboxylic acid hydrolase [Youngiibacter fragilis]ETA81722.1 hypothetical protein T472_0204825 [Youngiibacter fragilis 232.1]